MLNLNRCPFLSKAYAYICAHPNCCKADAVRCDRRNLPQRTLAYRYTALNALLRAHMVRNAGTPGGKYVLYVEGQTNG